MTKTALAVAITAAMLAAVALAAVITEHTQTSSLRAQLEHAEHVITAQQAKLAGGHRDLITCADIQSLISSGGLANYWQDSNYNLQSTPDTLPAHCVNN